MEMIQLIDSPISTVGKHTLNEDVSSYEVISVLGDLFEDKKDVISRVNHRNYSLVPPLTSDVNQGYVCSASSIYGAGNEAYGAFNYAATGSWCSKYSNGGWFQIQNTNGKFRTNMFTFYAGGSPDYNYYPAHLQILGSNDGENWDILVDDTTAYPSVRYSSRTYHLENYVEYAYIRCHIVTNAGTYCLCYSFLIQDSDVHTYASKIDSTSEVTKAYVPVYPPTSNVVATSTYGSYNKNSVVDNSFISEWCATGGHISLLLDGVDTTGVTHVTAVTMNNNAGFRYDRNIEVQGMYEDGTYDTFGSFVTWVGSTHRVAVPEGGISKYHSIRWFDKGKHSSGNRYVGFVDLCFEKEVTTNVHTINDGDSGISLVAFGNNAVLNFGSAAVNSLAINANSIIDTTPKTYRIYERDENGLPKLMLTNPISIASGIDNTNLKEDLAQLLTMTSVDDIIDRINTCTMGGRLDTEADLPTTDVKVGTIYMVGAEGSASYEEFIYTEDGNWDRLGTLRQSDVDLSDYTNTDGMNTAISNASSTLNVNITGMSNAIDVNIENMTASILTLISDANDEVDAVLAGISKEVEVVEDLPAEWPTDIIDEGMLVQVIE